MTAQPLAKTKANTKTKATDKPKAKPKPKPKAKPNPKPNGKPRRPKNSRAQAGLSEAIEQTVRSSLAFSDSVQAKFVELEEALQSDLTELEARLADSGVRADDLRKRVKATREELAATRKHIRDRRKLLKTFRVAMFGRTGAGKSSLIEALTAGDGATISPGRSDHTEDIREAEWGPLLVIDMPGVLGAGRNLTRAELEKRAEKEVKRADLVILAFDTQNQQQNEFEQVALMVERYRKPVVAVLNVRNPDWRSPDSSITVEQRGNRDTTVAQHIGHINGQLAAIGVTECPIVAINAQRATFARCKSYKGTHNAGTRNRDVKAFGTEQLLEASNLLTLEALLIELITSNCEKIRTRGLLGDLTKGAREAHQHLSDSTDQIVAEEHGIELLLNDLGYPREVNDEVDPMPKPPAVAAELLKSRKHSAFEKNTIKQAGDSARRASRGITRAAVTSAQCDELLALETLRAQPFGSSNAGRAHEHIEQGLVPVRRLRLSALRKAEEAVDRASAATNTKTEINLKEVIDPGGELKATAEAAVTAAITSTCKMLERTTAAVNHALRISAATATVRRGGRKARHASHLGRGVSVGMSIAVAVAATNFWNPGGWVVGGLVGLGVLASWFGGKLFKGSEKRRRKERSKAVALVRSKVDEAFSDLQSELERIYWSTITVLAADSLVAKLRHAVELRLAQRASVEAQAVANWAPPGSNAPIVPVSASGRLDGSGWAPAGEVSRDALAKQPGSTYPFSKLAWTPISVPSSALDAGLLDDLGLAIDALPQPSRPVLKRELTSIQRSAPKVVLGGNYSASKSSLRAVLTLKSRAARRKIPRGGNPTTRKVARAKLGPYAILDTPGFGSERSADPVAAANALAQASLVLYLVTPQLVADVPSDVLTRLAQPGVAGALERERTRFVLCRIDEMGSSPQFSPKEFERLVTAKRTELARILNDRGVKIKPADVIVISADPFSSDFDESVLSASRNWTGTEELRSQLLSLSSADLARCKERASFACALIRITGLAEQMQTNKEIWSGQLSGLSKLVKATEQARGRVKRTRAALEQRLLAELSPRFAELTDAIMAANDKKSREAAVSFAKEWQEDPAIQAAILAWQEVCAEAIDRLGEEIVPELERRIKSFESETRATQSDLFDEAFGSERADSDSKARKAAQRTSEVLGKVPGVDAAAILSVRDGLKLGDVIKFKPWGATKLARNLGRGTAALSIVAAITEVAFWVSDVRGAKKTDRKAQALKKQIQEATEGFVLDMMNMADGPGDVLGAFDGRLEDEQNKREGQIQSLERQSEDLDQSITTINHFLEGAASDG